MNRHYYATQEAALKSFIDMHLQEYLTGSPVGTIHDGLVVAVKCDSEKLFKDFHHELRQTLGELYYLNNEDLKL